MFGLVTVIVVAVMVIGYRMQLGTGRPIDRARRESPLILTMAAIVGLWVVIAVQGRVAFLILTPMVMTIVGVVLLTADDAAYARRGINIRRFGWGAIASAVVWVVAGLASIAVGKPL